MKELAVIERQLDRVLGFIPVSTPKRAAFLPSTRPY
jgi:hypothetical protein